MTALSNFEVAPVRAAILAWYRRGHRDLPWRGTRDPYAVLVSEVMLQQTQATRVAARYPAFVARFPDVQALASASEPDVLAAWSGLGYNRRALSLHRAAIAIAERGWPSDLEGLRRLPGVGQYTARAIGSLAFGWPVGAVDTNVRRWLVRRFDLDAGGAGSKSRIQRLADALAWVGEERAHDEAASWTHASMDLGAVVCRAQEPLCDACPVAVGCPARGAARRVPVPRQSPFRGSARAYRGAVLRALASAPGHSIGRNGLVNALAASAPKGALGDTILPRLAERAVEDLAREGLVHVDRDRLRLGSDRSRKGTGPGAYNRGDERQPAANG
jgi:A/G-specific adenine glycosylase